MTLPMAPQSWGRRPFPLLDALEPLQGGGRTEAKGSRLAMRTMASAWRQARKAALPSLRSSRRRVRGRCAWKGVRHDQGWQRRSIFPGLGAKFGRPSRCVPVSRHHSRKRPCCRDAYQEANPLPNIIGRSTNSSPPTKPTPCAEYTSSEGLLSPQGPAKATDPERCAQMRAKNRYESNDRVLMRPNRHPPNKWTNEAQ